MKPAMQALAAEGALVLSLNTTIATRLIADLRDRIVRGEIAPGTRLSEKQVASSYAGGMSRQPVREAFIRLASEGLLEIRPQRGTFVRKISTEEVAISRFVREAVEADVVRLAAATAGAGEIAVLRDQVEQQAEVQDRGASAFMPLDELFHKTLAEAAGRAGAWAHLQPIKMHMDRVRYLTAAEFPLAKLVGQHRSIVEAIAARDADAAEAAMRGHLRGVLDDLPEIVAVQPAYFEPGPERSGLVNQQQGRTS